MKIDNIRIFKENQEFTGKFKEQLLFEFSEIGDYKQYDKINQYEYLFIFIFSNKNKYFPKNTYTLAFAYSDDKDFYKSLKKSDSYFEWAIDFPSEEIDCLIRNIKINSILYD